MFCNHCGSAVTADQLVCNQCGRSPVDNRAGFVARNRVPEHLHLLGIFWIVVGCILFVPVPIMLVLSGIAGSIHIPDLPPVLHALGPLVFLTIAFFIALIAAPSLITGWGLIKVRPWGRMMAIVMAFILLLHPPFGTALAIYTLYVLLPGEAGAEYDRMAAQAEHNGVVQTKTA
jgi:hypothetical protein